MIFSYDFYFITNRFISLRKWKSADCAGLLNIAIPSASIAAIFNKQPCHSAFLAEYLMNKIFHIFLGKCLVLDQQYRIKTWIIFFFLSDGGCWQIAWTCLLPHWPFRLWKAVGKLAGGWVTWSSRGSTAMMEEFLQGENSSLMVTMEMENLAII